MNNDRLIAILFAMLIVVGAWRAYDYLARPDPTAAAVDPTSVLDPPSAREEPPPILPAPGEDAPAAAQSDAGQDGEAPQRIYRCRLDDEIVLSAEPCAAGTEAGEATPVLGRDRSERPSRAEAPSAARDRPETDCERIDRQLDGIDAKAQQRGAGADAEEAVARRNKLNQERVARGCGPRTRHP